MMFKKLLFPISIFLLSACASQSSLEKADALYEEGDLVNAQKMYVQALKEGYVPALNGLGNIAYDRNTIEKAEYFYQQATNYGNAHAYYLLGRLELFKRKPKNCNKALNYWLQGASYGNSAAINALYQKFNVTVSNYGPYSRYPGVGVFLDNLALQYHVQYGGSPKHNQELFNRTVAKCNAIDFTIKL